MLKIYRKLISTLISNRERKQMYLKLPTGAAFRYMPAYAYDGEKPLPAVVIVHGWKSDIFREGSTYSEMVKKLNFLGYHTLQISLRGHNGAEGDISLVTREEHMEDIRAGIAWLEKRSYVDSSKLSALGTSYGGYLLAALGPELNRFKMLALRAPALYRNDGWFKPAVDAVSVSDRVEWRKTIRTGGECRALLNLQAFHGDLLLLTSECDEDMPAQVGQSYRNAAFSCASFTRVELAGADHGLSNPEDRSKFLDITTKWFEERYPASHATTVA